MLKSLSLNGMINSEQHVTLKENKYKHMKTLLLSLVFILFTYTISAQNLQAKRDLNLNSTKAEDFKLEPRPSLKFNDIQKDTMADLDFKPKATLKSNLIYPDIKSKAEVFACIYILKNSENLKKKKN